MKKHLFAHLKHNWLFALLSFLTISSFSLSLVFYFQATRQAIYTPAGLSIIPKENGKNDDFFDISTLNGCLASPEHQAAAEKCAKFAAFGLTGLLSIEIIAALFLFGKLTKVRPKPKRKHLLLKLTGFSFLQLIAFLPFLLMVWIDDSIINRANQKAVKELDGVQLRFFSPPDDDPFGLIRPSKLVAESVLSDTEKTPITIAEYSPFLSALYLRSADLNNLSYYERYSLALASSEEMDKKIRDSSSTPVAYFSRYKTLFVLQESKEVYEDVLPPIITNNLISDEDIGKYISTDSALNFSVLLSDEYNSIREKKNEEIKEEFIDTIYSIRESLVKLSQAVSYNTDTLSSLEREKTDYESRWESWPNTCKKQLGDTNDICVEGKRTIQTAIQSYQLSIDEFKQAIATGEKYTAESNKNLAQWNKALDNFNKNPIGVSGEAGVFFSPDQVYLRFKNDGLPIEETGTAIHELLHFYSYNKTSSLPSFLNEGITEYLTLSVRDETVGAHEGNSYPELVEVARVLSDRLGKNQVLDFYFSKSLPLFKKSFTGVYGGGDYQKFMDLGDKLYFAPLNEEISREQLKDEMVQIIGKNEND